MKIARLDEDALRSLEDLRGPCNIVVRMGPHCYPATLDVRQVKYVPYPDRGGGSLELGEGHYLVEVEGAGPQGEA